MNDRVFPLFCHLVLGILPCSAVHAGDLYVDVANPCPGSGTSVDPFCAIQAGIDAAGAGDVVHVAPGTYNEAINFSGKPVTLTGTAGPEATIIDATGLNTSVVSGAGNDTVLQGFTITGGNAATGGGMLLAFNSPAVADCIFEGNRADSLGGGLYNAGGNPEITNCTFRDNVSGGDGGGIYSLFNGSPTVSGCRFEANSATNGGGMFIVGGNSLIVDCTFDSNIAVEHAGGLAHFLGADSEVLRCVFFQNQAGMRAGGVGNSNGSAPMIAQCTFVENIAGDGGAMLNQIESAPTIDGCAFQGNAATSQGGAILNRNSITRISRSSFMYCSARWGGAIYNIESTCALVNCKLSSNSALYLGAAINNNRDVSLGVLNCTFHGNDAGDAGGGIMNARTTSFAVITNSIFRSNAPEGIAGDNLTVTFSNTGGGSGEPWFGPTNIDLDPKFMNPAAGVLQLRPDSPCVDAGDNAAPNLPATDLAGVDRVIDGDGDLVAVVDMGAYEYRPVSADLDADGDVDGTDFLTFSNCFNGELNPPKAGCLNIEADLDGDGDVDPNDFLTLSNCFNGALTPPACP